jgi:hypothetical protein
MRNRGRECDDRISVLAVQSNEKLDEDTVVGIIFNMRKFRYTYIKHADFDRG